MPCDSRIEVKVTDMNRLAAALKALGHSVEVQRESGRIFANRDGRTIIFTHGTAGAYVDGDRSNLSAIMRKYAEIGVRNFARTRGYTIAEADGINMTLINRRG